MAEIYRTFPLLSVRLTSNRQSISSAFTWCVRGKRQISSNHWIFSDKCEEKAWAKGSANACMQNQRYSLEIPRRVIKKNAPKYWKIMFNVAQQKDSIDALERNTSSNSFTTGQNVIQILFHIFFDVFNSISAIFFRFAFFPFRFFSLLS